MSEITIPLNDSEIETLLVARAHMSAAFRDNLKAIMAIAGDTTILAPLHANYEMLREVCRNAEEKKRLSYDDLGDLLAIKETFHAEMSDLNLLIPQIFADSDEKGKGMEIGKMEKTRHNILAEIAKASKMMNRVFSLVEQKASALDRVNTGATGSTERAK